MGFNRGAPNGRPSLYNSLVKVMTVWRLAASVQSIP
jgi:hypothetical protein